MDLKSTPFLEIDALAHNVKSTVQEDGTIYISSNVAFEDHPDRMTERLIHWAETIPNDVFLGQRTKTGEWRTISYQETYDKVQALGQYLLYNGVSVDRPLAILSGNSIEHGLIALAALHIGVPYSPVSPAYSTKSTDFAKLKHCIDLLTPGLLFVQDGSAFANAIKSVTGDSKVLVVENAQEGQERFDEAINTSVTEAVENAYQAISASTIAKILFTSGSTGQPKGVINTHGNITTNWQQITQTFPFMKNENDGLTLIDWLPWNHVFGGNHNFGLTLYNGGSLYIDEGNPTPMGFKTTIKNLGDIAPTIYFNVPKGFEELVNHLKTDSALSKFFFSRLKMFFYAGASMPAHVWDGLEELAYKTTGKRLLISTGLGMTEASPSCMFNTQVGRSSADLGVPVPGLEAKLVPDGDKMEARFKGGNVTPGYWRNPSATAQAFDEEGYYKTGDALVLINPIDINEGMRFDGRIAEDFKLVTGTWVSVGVLRNKLITAGNGLIQDVVITGHDRDYIGAIVFPEVNNCRKHTGQSVSTSLPELVNHPKLIEALQDRLDQLGRTSTGSSTLIKKAIWADFELSIDNGEITDKGSINQRAILKNRADVVEKIYEEHASLEVLEYK